MTPKSVTIEVVPEAKLYEDRYKKTFNVKDVKSHFFYRRGKYPSRVMFYVTGHSQTIYKTQMSLKKFEKLFPNSIKKPGRHLT